MLDWSDMCWRTSVFCIHTVFIQIVAHWVWARYEAGIFWWAQNLTSNISSGLEIWPQIYHQRAELQISGQFIIDSYNLIQKSLFSPIFVCQELDCGEGWVSISAWAFIWMNAVHLLFETTFVYSYRWSLYVGFTVYFMTNCAASWIPMIIQKIMFWQVTAALFHWNKYECQMMGSGPWVKSWKTPRKAWIYLHILAKDAYSSRSDSDHIISSLWNAAFEAWSRNSDLSQKTSITAYLEWP